MQNRNPKRSRKAEPPVRDVTRLLGEVANGNEGATKELFEKVYDELRRCARNYVRREHQTLTLQATALVHEAFLKLVVQREDGWRNRGHFLAIASMAMRRILVDSARARRAAKRAHESVPLEDDVLPFSPLQSDELLALDQALEALALHDARACEVIKLQYFGGMSQKDVAAYLDVDEKTIWRKSKYARAWLNSEMRKSLS